MLITRAPTAPVLTPRLPRDLLTLIRPGQWAKSLLVVPLALLDTRTLTFGAGLRIGWAILAFLLASAIIYVVNDFSDRHLDRLHPVKRFRPLAAGRVSPRQAGVLAAVLAVALAGVLSMSSPAVWWPIAAYVCLNVAYSRKLKHLPLLDVFTVSLGFVLRVVLGYLAVGSPISHWLLVAVFALCLLLSLGKRRHELTLSADQHRPALRGYSVPFVDQLLLLTSTLAVVTCLLYLQSGPPIAPYDTLAVLVSAPCALFGLFRYLQVVTVGEGGGNPVRALLRDRVMVANALVWLGLLGLLLAVKNFPS